MTFNNAIMHHMNINLEILAPYIEYVIKKIQNDDQFLISRGQERALSTKIGMYLNNIFSGWTVDCEYNRVGHGNDLKNCSCNGYKVPDIIIHHRGLKDIKNNLLWIEVKIQNNNINEDIEKLKEFTKPPEGKRKIQYQYGLSLSFMPDIKKVWIFEGREI